MSVSAGDAGQRPGAGTHYAPPDRRGNGKAALQRQRPEDRHQPAESGLIKAKATKVSPGQRLRGNRRDFGRITNYGLPH